MKAPIRSLIAISLSIVSLSTVHAAPEFEPTNNSKFTQICMAAATSSPKKLHRTIRKAKLTKQKALVTVQCNDMTLVDFVAQYSENATEITGFLTDNRIDRSLSAKLSEQ